jgi:hypothetical protein
LISSHVARAPTPARAHPFLASFSYFLKKSRGVAMSTRQAVLLASRTLALLMVILALTELSYVPSSLHSFLRYAQQGVVTSSSEYWRHQYLMQLGFLITRIVGFSLTSIWLFKGGAEIHQLLLPDEDEQVLQR